MPKPAKLKYLGNFDKGAATDTSVRIHHKKPKEKFLKQRDQNYWYIKKASHADIEATVGSFYNLMLNDCAPKSRAVKEISAAEVNFHASKQIHFKRMDASKTEYKEALPAEGPYPERKARPYGAEFRCGQKQAKSLARALVANYIFAENDCHYKNVGIIEETSQICRIDFGQSLWPLLCKYQKTPIMPDQVDRNFYNIKPAEAFPITTRDLINFPLCKGSDAKPLNTIRVIFENTAAKKEFEKQKWKYFLKALLLSQSMFQKIAEQFIENTSVKAEIVRYMTARLQLLENSLLTIPEFNQYIINNIDEFESELFNEFRAYNALKKPSDPVQFDINAVKLKWKQLTANAHAKLVLSSDTYRASKIEMLNQFLVKELERLGSGSHEKTHQIRTCLKQLNSISSRSAEEQIAIFCTIATQLDCITIMRRGCGWWEPKSQINWTLFKAQHGFWLEAFNEANSKKMDEASFNTAGLFHARSPFSASSPLLSKTPASYS